jgi:hypothetical protein
VRKKLTKFAKYSPTRDLLVEAGPRDDGTFDIDAIAHNVEATGNAAAATERLSTWLYDYASYALFLAQPHLAKRDADASARVSERLLQILDPIAPAEKRSRDAVTKRPTKGGTLPPPARGATSRLPRVRIPGVDPSRTVKIAPFDEKKIAEALAARANAKPPAAAPSKHAPRGRFAGLAAAVLVVFAVASLGYVCGSRSATRGVAASHP